ncbi:MAG TPA: M50 family metallopeptidase [Polyangiaceae bacterium]|nr:M50 family metallopeptidase [Polyangiaceae bacterium]
MNTRSRGLGRLIRNVDLKAVLGLLAVFALVAGLWGTFAVTPLKIFVVLLHEISHGIAAVLTGGSIVKMEINVRQGGVCYTTGGIRFFVLSAGYLGSMLWGGLIVVAASRSKRQRWISLGIGGFVLAVTVLYVRSWFGFGFALLASGLLIVMGLKLSHDINQFVLQVIGVTSCLYAVLDIVDDVLQRPGIGSDADMLADLTFVPSVVWGVIWIAIAVVVPAACLLVAAQKPAVASTPKPRFR